ncbi:hypothetical protein LguiA_010886 [Lonicera macranthoides]
MPPARFLETAPNKMKKRSENESGISKPKLKVLHWDKVKANTNRAMVWDQLKSNSFHVSLKKYHSQSGIVHLRRVEMHKHFQGSE